MVPEGFVLINGVGCIPKDWKAFSADTFCSKITKGTTPPKSEIVGVRVIPFLRVNNLSFEGRLDSNSKLLFVSKAAHSGILARSIAYPGDILMNIVGPPLGKTAILCDDYAEYNMNQAIVIYRVDSPEADKQYFLSYLKSNIAQQWFQSRSKKTSGQQNLTIELCKELPVPIPPLPEQKKIAKILSTWDRAIEVTEKLLNNSQQQKKSLMQQLFTGKKRLPGFGGEWNYIDLSKVVSVGRGFAFKSSEYSEIGHKIIRVTNISSDGKIDTGENCVFIPENKVKIYEKYRLLENDVLIVMVGATAGKLGYVNVDVLPALLNQNMWVLRALNNKILCQVFFKYIIQKSVNKYLTEQQGSARGFFTQSTFGKVKLNFPLLDEQQKIVSILTTSDKEIETLQQKLNHLKQEKKALMQQLLTGKRRVVV